MKKAKALVTGCNGFVGHYLVGHLQDAGYEVAGLDIQETPRLAGLEYCRHHLGGDKNFSDLVASTGVKQIYHLAALSNPQISNTDPQGTVEANILGSLAIFDAVRNNPGCKALIVGSSEMYKARSGDSVEFREDDPLESRSMYGTTKACAELIGKQYFRQFGTDLVFTRSFNHTGPGQAPLYVLSDWAMQCAKIGKGLSEPLLKVGNIDVARDFLDVRDVVRAYHLLMEKGLAGESYNVASGKGYKLRDLLGQLVSLTGQSKVSIEIDTSRVRANDPALIFGARNKISESTGWAPEYKLEKTLEQLYEWWLERV